MFALEAAITSIPFQKFKVSGAAIDTAMIDVASFLFLSLSLSLTLSLPHTFWHKLTYEKAQWNMKWKRRRMLQLFILFTIFHQSCSHCVNDRAVWEKLSLYALFIHGRIHFI